DTTAHPSTGSVDVDSSGVPIFPTSAGTSRYHVVVRDSAGRPIANARVRLLGGSTARADANGAGALDSLASGAHTLEGLSIGHQPERRAVDVAAQREATDTVVLASLNALDTVRITASRDPMGFERRRETRTGQFITADDVVKENPLNTTHLLR